MKNVKTSEKKKVEMAKSWYGTLYETYEKGFEFMQTEVQNKDFELENLKAALIELKISLDEKLSNADSYEKRLIEREKEVLRLQVKLEKNPVDFLKLNENYEQKVSND